jgi:hypothetical protein
MFLTVGTVLSSRPWQMTLAAIHWMTRHCAITGIQLPTT